MDIYTCTCCKSKEITHCLVKGSLDQGYKELPLCSKCAEIIDNASPYHWDLNSIVELINIKDSTKNFSWRKELFGKV